MSGANKSNLVALGLILIALYFYYHNKIYLPTNPFKPTATQLIMKLSSPAFGDNQNLPATYTCDGRGVNPPLNISDVPADTKSLALVVEDPDAPSGMFIHWTLWNIPPHTLLIPENSIPAGASVGLNGAGKPGFIGACPPSGTHHYHFKLYALNQTLDLPANTTAASLQAALASSLIEQAELTALYQRPGKPN